MAEERKIIDEANYPQQQIMQNYQNGPSYVGKGGDPLFKNIIATKSQLIELLDETTAIQDWMQREACNKIALDFLSNENLEEIYFEIKDGFGEFGPMLLMGFKSPQGVEIPRLKLLDKEGNIIEVLSGPMAIQEITKRANIYKESLSATTKIENIDFVEEDEDDVIIKENISDYVQ